MVGIIFLMTLKLRGATSVAFNLSRIMVGLYFVLITKMFVIINVICNHLTFIRQIIFFNKIFLAAHNMKRLLRIGRDKYGDRPINTPHHFRHYLVLIMVVL